MNISSKPIVTVTRKLPDTIEARMQTLFDVRLNKDDHPLTRAELMTAVKESHILVPTIGDVIDANLLAHTGENLTMIANFGTGFDHIDVRSARQRHITVTNTPDVFAEDTADMTIAMLLALPRRIIEGIQMMQTGSWQGWSPLGLVGRRIAGKTLGIIGLGRVGEAVARRAKAFGLKIIYHNRKPLPKSLETELGAVYYENLDPLLIASDFVSVHCPHTPATYHLLSARRLDLMRPDAYLINTSRGEVIDEKALVRKLKNKSLAGAALDVYQAEPHINPDFRGLENILLLPHMSSATIEGRKSAGERVIVNIQTHLSGHAPPDRILPSML